MIDTKSTLKIALNSLKVNKMRSALTSLGIIIGVSAVIIMLAIGSGANKQVQSNMESMGSNLLTIRSATAKTGGVSMGMGTKPTLSIKDAEAIKKMYEDKAFRENCGINNQQHVKKYDVSNVAEFMRTIYSEVEKTR